MTEVAKTIDLLMNGPTLADGSRLEGYTLRGFNAWFAPKCTDPEVRAKAIREVLEDYFAGKTKASPNVDF